MKRIEFRGRMLRCREVGSGRLGKLWELRQQQDICRNHHGCVQRDVRRRQQAWRLRGNHRLAAVVMLIGGCARHRAAALHALLVEGHRRHAVSELQEQHRDHRQDQECGFSNHILTLRRLDARVKK